MGSQQSIPTPRHATRIGAWLAAVAVACIGLLPALHGWQHAAEHVGSHAAAHYPSAHHPSAHHPLAHDHHHTDPHDHASHGDTSDGHAEPGEHHDHDPDHECTTCVLLKLAARGLITPASPTAVGFVAVTRGDSPPHRDTPPARTLSARSTRGPPPIA